MNERRTYVQVVVYFREQVLVVVENKWIGQKTLMCGWDKGKGQTLSTATHFNFDLFFRDGFLIGDVSNGTDILIHYKMVKMGKVITLRAEKHI